MKTCRFLGLIIGFGLLWSCASAPQRPIWIAGNSPEYPAERYLVGRGQADNPALARDRARSDLAKNFQVQVSEESRDLLSYARTDTGTDSSSRLESEVSRNIVTRTDQVIEGVRIAELWEDPKTGTVHALAVLDRLQAGNQLRRLVTELDREVAAQVERARSREDVLAKIGAASQALAAEVERRHYEKYLQVVDRTGMGARGSHDPVSLKADLAELLTRVRITPEVEQDSLGGLERAAAGALSAAGFLHATGGEPTHVLTLRDSVQESSSSDGWHWVRGSLELSLQAADSGRVVGTHRWPIKASAQQPGMARARAAEQAEALLKEDLREVIVGFGSPGEAR